jgi:hypothetical protein
MGKQTAHPVYLEHWVWPSAVLRMKSSYHHQLSSGTRSAQGARVTRIAGRACTLCFSFPQPPGAFEKEKKKNACACVTEAC